MRQTNRQKTQHTIIREFLKAQISDAPTDDEREFIRPFMFAIRRDSNLFRALLPLATDYFTRDNHIFVSYWEMINRLRAIIGTPLIPIANRTYEDIRNDFITSRVARNIDYHGRSPGYYWAARE